MSCYSSSQTQDEKVLKYLKKERILYSTISFITDFRENPPIFSPRTEEDEKLNQIHTSYEGYLKNKNDYERDSVQIQIFMYLEDLFSKYFLEENLRFEWYEGAECFLGMEDKDSNDEDPWGKNGIIVSNSDLNFLSEDNQIHITYKQLHQYDILSDFICDEFSKYVMNSVGYVVSMDLTRLADIYDEDKTGLYFLVIIAEKYDSEYFDENNQRNYIREFDKDRHKNWNKELEDNNKWVKSFNKVKKNEEEEDNENSTESYIETNRNFSKKNSTIEEKYLWSEYEQFNGNWKDFKKFLKDREENILDDNIIKNDIYVKN